MPPDNLQKTARKKRDLSHKDVSMYFAIRFESQPLFILKSLAIQQNTLVELMYKAYFFSAACVE